MSKIFAPSKPKPKPQPVVKEVPKPDYESAEKSAEDTRRREKQARGRTSNIYAGRSVSSTPNVGTATLLGQ